MVAIQPGQVFTTWDFLRSQTTGICSGTRRTDRPINHIICHMTWFDVKEEHMMEAYISRYKDENVMSILEDVKHNSEYGCADPRLHSRAREAVTRFTNIATERPKDIKKTSNPCISSSMITLKSIM